MARIPKNLLTRTITPGWVFTVEALTVAVLAHVVIFTLAGYQPEQKTETAPSSPGVSLLTRTEFSGKEWTQLRNWIAVHDPSQISRADSPAGYTALLKADRTRAIEELRSGAPSEKPPFPALPGYVPLATAATEENMETAPVFGGTLTEPELRAPVPVRVPAVRDETGVPVQLDQLSVPAVTSFPGQPTIIKVWGTPGLMRQHLVESCGVPELDRAALQAVAAERFDTPRTIVVSWPEAPPGKGGETKKEEP